MAHVYSALRISVLTKIHSLDAVLLLFIKQGCCVFGIEDQRCVYSALRFTVFGHVLQILGEQVGSA